MPPKRKIERNEKNKITKQKLEQYRLFPDYRDAVREIIGYLDYFSRKRLAWTCKMAMEFFPKSRVIGSYLKKESGIKADAKFDKEELVELSTHDLTDFSPDFKDNPLLKYREAKYARIYELEYSPSEVCYYPYMISSDIYNAFPNLEYVELIGMRFPVSIFVTEHMKWKILKVSSKTKTKTMIHFYDVSIILRKDVEEIGIHVATPNAMISVDPTYHGHCKSKHIGKLYCNKKFRLLLECTKERMLSASKIHSV